MGSLAVILNIIVFGYSFYEFCVKTYKFINYKLFSYNYLIDYDYLGTLYLTIPLIVISSFNIVLILKIVEIQLINYLVLVINFIIFLFFLMLVYFGISDELSDNKIEKTKLFFSVENYQIILLILFGIALPIMCIIKIFKKKIK